MKDALECHIEYYSATFFLRKNAATTNGKLVHVYRMPVVTTTRHTRYKIDDRRSLPQVVTTDRLFPGLAMLHTR
ncbi:hypothetical protein M378DRAFT_170157 [Amanita muscaria Koide BX008]|uniref:Uncharacterized protein n=1 Tax=Amanita muscaria (strain Koide BX008) TaxID=946122 RepID=A0A0C2WR70_AMAMK|nr:hypothetical protein M378DRAFT_170157 [Amanita muscaria Koide BX008]